MNVAALRYFRGLENRQLPLVLAFPVFVVWLMLGWLPGGDAEENDEERLMIQHRMADVSLTLERELSDLELPEWLWPLLFLEGEAAARESVREDLEMAQLLDQTQADEVMVALAGKDPGDRAELLATLLFEDRLPTQEEWRSLEAMFEERGLWEWEAQAFERLTGEAERPEWLVDALDWQREFRRKVSSWALLSWGLGIAIVLVGLVFLPQVIAALRTRQQAPRWMNWGSVGWVITAYMLADIIADQAIAAGYNVLVLVVDDWPFALDILIDASWRIGWALTALTLLFWRPGVAGKVFRFRNQVPWRLVLGVFALLAIFDTLWYPLALECWPEEPYLMLDEDGWDGLFYSVLSSVVLAPLCEKLVYRGVLFGGLWRKLGFWPAALGSSVVFSVIHHYGVGGSVSVGLLGLAACVIYRRTGSLVGPIVLHALYNGLITFATWPVYNGPYS